MKDIKKTLTDLLKEELSSLVQRNHPKEQNPVVKSYLGMLKQLEHDNTDDVYDLKNLSTALDLFNRQILNTIKKYEETGRWDESIREELDTNGFSPVEIPSDKLEEIKFMLNSVGIDQAIRDVLGFNKVYKSRISIDNGSIVISLMAKDRKPIKVPTKWGGVSESKEQNYLVRFRIGEDDDDDMEVKATSKEEAIEKAKAKAPRLSRSFSAELYKN